MLGIMTIFAFTFGIIGLIFNNSYLIAIALGLLFLIKLRLSCVIDDIKNSFSKEDLD